MNKKLQVILLTSLFLINIAPAVHANNKPINHFYTYLTDEKVYEEYKNATLNDRKNLKLTAYKDLEKELGQQLIIVGHLPKSLPMILVP